MAILSEAVATSCYHLHASSVGKVEVCIPLVTMSAPLAVYCSLFSVVCSLPSSPIHHAQNIHLSLLPTNEYLQCSPRPPRNFHRASCSLSLEVICSINHYSPTSQYIQPAVQHRSPNLPSRHLHSHSSCSTNMSSSSSSPSSSSSLTRSIKTFFPFSPLCRFLPRAPPLLPPRPRPSPCSLLIFFNCAVLIFGTPFNFPMPCAASAACTAVLINFWMPCAPLVSPWYSTDGSRELERDGDGDGVRGMMRSCFSASVVLISHHPANVLPRHTKLEKEKTYLGCDT